MIGLQKRFINRLRAFGLSDGVALLVLGLGILARGVSYIPNGGGRSVSHPAEAALPMSAWAGVWIGVGLACIVTAWWAESHAAAVALGVGVGLNLLWAGSFLAVSVTGDMPRGWVSAVGYISVSVLVMWSTWRSGKLRLVEGESSSGGDR